MNPGMFGFPPGPSSNSRQVRPTTVLTSGTGNHVWAPGTKWAYVIIQPAGGGGGKAGASTTGGHGGGAGAMMEFWMRVNSASSPYVIGAAGVGATVNNTAGGDGSNSRFASITAHGGKGGSTPNLVAGAGAGGATGNGSAANGSGIGGLGIAGGAGGVALHPSAGVNGNAANFPDPTSAAFAGTGSALGGAAAGGFGGGGGGGDSAYGFGGIGGAGSATNGAIGGAPTGFGGGGGGGGGGNTSCGNGGNGGPPVAYITEYK